MNSAESHIQHLTDHIDVLQHNIDGISKTINVCSMHIMIVPLRT